MSISWGSRSGALQSYDEQFHGGVRDFPATFREKYDRAARFGKPVIIAELGISGNRTYRETWMRSLFDDAGRFLNGFAPCVPWSISMTRNPITGPSVWDLRTGG